MNSTQIVGEDEELWVAFIKRDIPLWETKKLTPEDPTQWHKLYFVGRRAASRVLPCPVLTHRQDLHKQSRADRDKDAESLRAKLQGIQSEKANHTSRLVDVSALPNVGRHTRVGGSSRGTGSAAASRDRPPGFLNKARREIRDMGIFAHRRRIIEQASPPRNNSVANRHSALQLVPASTARPLGGGNPNPSNLYTAGPLLRARTTTTTTTTTTMATARRATSASTRPASSNGIDTRPPNTDPARPRRRPASTSSTPLAAAATATSTASEGRMLKRKAPTDDTSARRRDTETSSGPRLAKLARRQ